MIPSFVFKRRAWAAIKPWMQVLVIIGLLAVLPGLINEVATILLNEETTAALQGPAMDVLEFTLLPLPETMTAEEEAAILAEADALSTAFREAGVAFLQDRGWILLVTFGVELLLAPVFMAPLYGALLDALRKKEITIPGALRYLRRGPKMLVLILWMALRVCVWSLPGMALMIAALFVPAGVGTALMWLGCAVTVVLGVRAMLHYVLAPIVLMDKPGLSHNGCIRASREVMRNRKMEYFMLRVSFVGWHLLISLISMLAVNAVMMAIVLTVTMMANLLLTIYVNGTVVVFWDAYGVQLQKKADPAELDRDPDHPGEDLN